MGRQAGAAAAEAHRPSRGERDNEPVCSEGTHGTITLGIETLSRNVQVSAYLHSD